SPPDNALRTRRVQYPSADRCIALQVAAAFSTQGASSRPLRNRIDAMMTQTRPTELHQRRILMTRKPAAAAEARSQVRAVIRGWEIPVDPDIAVLLTSDLVTHAIVHWDSATITLAVRCSRDQLRVDVYDTSLPLPMAVDEQAMTETRPGLALAASLATASGSFLTFTAQATYFALACQPDWLPI